MKPYDLAVARLENCNLSETILSSVFSLSICSTFVFTHRAVRLH